MLLERLAFQGLRNLVDGTWRPAPGLNALVGANGAGKTSILEAVHLLGTGRSMRGAALDAVINYGAGALLVEGTLVTGSELDVGRKRRQQLGLRRVRNGRLELRCDGLTLQATSNLAMTFPQQVVSPDSIDLLFSGPGTRRRFLDWGVFHVEHQFMALVRGYRKALAQRNAVLRQQGTAAALVPWERELHAQGEQIAQARRRWLDGFQPVFQQLLSALADVELTLTLQQGWDAAESLAEALERTRDRDRKRGFTQQGPHRADLRVRMASGPGAGRSAVDGLSRGQAKVVACALLASQGQYLKMATGRECVVLVDDLAAELDQGHQDRLIDLLLAQHHQVVLTAVQDAVVERIAGHVPVTMFHVKHGRIYPAEPGTTR